MFSSKIVIIKQNISLFCLKKSKIFLLSGLIFLLILGSMALLPEIDRKNGQGNDDACSADNH